MKCEAKTWLLILAGCAAFALAGCETKTAPIAANTPPTAPEPQVMPGPPAVMPGPPAQSATVPPTDTVPPVDTPPAPVVNPEPAVPAVVPDPPATPTEVVKAEKGVAAQGRSLDQYEGLVVTPAKAYFAVREKVVFEIQIPGAYKLYRATEEAPLTFDEFKEKVLVPNQIKLPALPPGHTYEWDPEKEELNVRRPVK